ncbi:hypothetical protein [Lysinibacillus sp. JNUCC 51]|uniref:hypothetical protein n=1 Tax=Lysinibacillus sp. JNUCC-51 TaxID=2792479 RepID=UPI0019363BFB|nr:hypothetical protein JNUCC51_20500 [Lysinibacillus sp. JNUCC-51]
MDSIHAGTGLDSHHVGQKALMKKFIPGYDELKAPAIFVPRDGHTRKIPGVGIVSIQKNLCNNVLL